MPGVLKTCNVCGGNISSRANSCPHCGNPQHKTVGEAYSLGGFGLLDLIPGVRDLSTGVKFVLLIIILVILVPPVVYLILR